MKIIILLMITFFITACTGNLQSIPFEPSVTFNTHKAPHKVALVFPPELIGYSYQIDSLGTSGKIDVGNKLVLSIYNLLSCKVEHIIPVRDDAVSKNNYKDYELIFIPNFYNPSFSSPILGMGGFDFSASIGITVKDSNGNVLKQLSSPKTKKSNLAYNAVNGALEASLKGLERQLDDFIFNEMRW